MRPEERLEMLSSFITANHILSHHGLLDGFGHISLRNPENPDTFFSTGFMPPALMRDKEDIGVLTVDTATPVCGSIRGFDSPYSERYIHSEIFKMFPDVQSIVHSHSKPVVAQASIGGSMRPIWHMAGFLGENVPVFDPHDIYGEGDKQNLLITNHRLGEALASMFADPASGPSGRNTLPDRTVVLQRGHGFVTWGTSLRQAVYRAVYTQENAQIQQQSENLAQLQGGGKAIYLHNLEVGHAKEMNDGAIVKAWPYWEAQVQVDPLYNNNLAVKLST